jgi:hypothetical protein
LPDDQGVNITPREIYDLVLDVKAAVTDVQHDTKNMRVQLGEVHTQARITNGRVTQLEKDFAMHEALPAHQGASDDSDDHETRLRALEKTVWKTTGLAAGVSIVMTLLIKILPIPAP